ncbi:MAG: leucine-rich repeat protein, partial [Clostridia bacterium]|nr:leucine-rich repeat protein [Clostridia bacterium]
CGTTKVADAEDADGSVGGIDWDYDADDKVLKIEGTGAIPDFDAPENVDWYAVRHSVESIEISEGITSIGDHAFYYCPALEDIEIPATVTSLGDLSFAFCSSLVNIDLPDSLVSIGDGCFEACISLKGINVPAAVTSIGERAFAHCSSMKDAVIMAQITSVKSWTFMGCSSLEKLLFNDATRGIEVAEDAFEDASMNFENATFTADNTGKLTLTVNYIYEDGSAAADPYITQLEMGDDYSVVSPEIENYQASELTVSGIISEDKAVNVVYKSTVEEAETEPVTEIEETDEVVEEESEEIGVGTIIALVILGVVIVGIIVLVIVMMRSDKKPTNGKDQKNGKRK